MIKVVIVKGHDAKVRYNDQKSKGQAWQLSTDMVEGLKIGDQS